MVLLAFGVLSAFALLELVRDSTLAGSVDVSVLGVSFGTRSAQAILIVAVGLAVVATALVLGGSVALRAGRRRRRSKRGEEELVRTSRLETTERLLEYRVDGLLAQVRELEERKTELRAELEAEHVAHATVDDVVMLPDAPLRALDPDPAERADPSRLDEGRRWR